MGKQLSKKDPDRKTCLQASHENTQVPFFLFPGSFFFFSPIFLCTPAILHNPLQRAEDFKYQHEVWEINLDQGVGYIMNKSGEIVYI